MAGGIKILPQVRSGFPRFIVDGALWKPSWLLHTPWSCPWLGPDSASHPPRPPFSKIEIPNIPRKLEDHSSLLFLLICENEIGSLDVCLGHRAGQRLPEQGLKSHVLVIWITKVSTPGWGWG